MRSRALHQLSIVGLAALACGCLLPAGRAKDPAAGAAAALEDAPASHLRQVLAEVNGRSITGEEFIRRVLQQFGTAKLLAGVITQELVLQEAERLGIAVPDAEVDARVEAAILDEEKAAGGREALERQYARLSLTLAQVREERRIEARRQLVLARVIASRRDVDDRALEEYYRQTYAHRRYETRHIAYAFRADAGETGPDEDVRKLEAFNKASRAADRVRKGLADFAELARAESDDRVTAPRGGQLGAVYREMQLPPYMEAVFRLGAGEVSDPVLNDLGGYHVFQVTAILESQSFADCKEAMRREILGAEPTQAEVEKALQQLWEEAKIHLSNGPLLGGDGAPDAGAARGGGTGTGAGTGQGVKEEGEPDDRAQGG